MPHTFDNPQLPDKEKSEELMPTSKPEADSAMPMAQGTGEWPIEGRENSRLEAMGDFEKKQLITLVETAIREGKPEQAFEEARQNGVSEHAVKEAAGDVMVRLLSSGFIKRAQEVVTLFDVPESLVLPHMKKIIRQDFDGYTLDGFKEIIEEFDLNKEFYEPILIDRLTSQIQNDHHGWAFHVAEELDIPKDALRDVAQRTLEDRLQKRDIDVALDVAKYLEMELPEQVMRDARTRDEGIRQYKKMLKDYSYRMDWLAKLEEKFEMTEQEVRSATAEQVASLKLNEKKKPKKKQSKRKPEKSAFGIRNLNLKRKEVETGCINHMAREFLRRGELEFPSIEKEMTELNIKKKDWPKVGLKAVQLMLLSDIYRHDVIARDIRDCFGVSKSDVEDLVTDRLIELFRAGDREAAIKMSRTFELPDTIMQSKEMQDAIQHGTPERF